MSNPLTTHVLNTATGTPAAGLQISLEKLMAGSFQAVSSGTTNDDGRLSESLVGDLWGAGVYRMRFETGAYFVAQKQTCFYPHVEVVFEVHEPDEHYHVPLLLSPFGYSPYRGS